MDLPPTIPTSFVPQSTAATTRKFRADYMGAFGFLAYGIFIIVFVLAIAVFFYGQVLGATRNAKDQALASAEAAIDPATVESFVQLRDRLDSGTTLLNNHIALTGFFTLVESLLPTSVRFTALHLVTAADTGDLKLDGSGVAKSFNALDAASTAFAKDGRIKDAIFSNIVIGKDNTVSFTLVATLDPRLVAFTPSAVPVPAATSTMVTPEESSSTPAAPTPTTP